ncbi:hypothetical protein DFP72DRAFT_897640 [Ephemerocybe angulata]|uniref:F-box domain-containing protein n=1 Tax=Ephemerocybe angulata TaxID=980116 RepID=A0A8H6HXM4_9AGAR|nr:hypothetical protein DFP72DRAFT_897640 [Tulosesus angulatus]
MESQDGSSDMLSDSYFVPPPLEVATMRQQIPPMMTEISELRSRLKELEGRFSRYRSATSPLRRVPPEILGEIFHIAMGPAAINFGTKGDLTAILLVCKKWRDAAYLTGKLWGCISLRLPRTRQMSYEKLSNWMGRSKGTTPDRCHCDEMGVCELATSLLVEFLVGGRPIHRLEILSLPPRCFQELMDRVKAQVDGHDLAKASWNQLQELKLDFEAFEDIAPKNFETGGEDVSQSVFRHIPPLSSLTLSLPRDRSEVAWTHHIHLPPTALQTLTTFHLNCRWDGPQIFVFLQHCQSLQTLYLGLEHAYWTWNPENVNVPSLSGDPGCIILPNLRTLTISVSDTVQTALKLGKHLRVPSLLDLHVKQWAKTTDYSGICTALVALSPIWVQRTKLMRSLTLQDTTGFEYSKLSAKELTDILSRFGDAAHFATSFSFNAKDFLELQTLDDAVRLLPSLEHLEITHIKADFDLESFFQYIECRRLVQSNDEGQADRLKTLTLSGHPDLDHGQVNQLAQAYRESSYPKLLKESFGIVVNFLPRGSPVYT